MATYAIDYFELPTSSTATSRGFFSAAFGWSFTEYGPGYSEFADAGLIGGLNAEDEGVAVPFVGIRTDDIAAAVRAVEAAGGTITKSIYDYPGGQRFFFREPGGAVLMVYQPSE
jgi:uncharacterized protein